MTSTRDTRSLLDAALVERILILDGAMGTMIQRRGLGEAEFRTPRWSRGSSSLTAQWAR